MFCVHRNELHHNPEFIMLLIRVMNSGLWRSFRAHSDEHGTTKIRHFIVFAYLSKSKIIIFRKIFFKHKINFLFLKARHAFGDFQATVSMTPLKFQRVQELYIVV